MGRERISVNEEAMEILVRYTWKGNIRELENVIERLVILSKESTIKKEDLPKDMYLKKDENQQLILSDEGINLEELEKSLIKQALSKAENNRTRAAKLLGITRHTLLYRMEKYDLKDE